MVFATAGASGIGIKQGKVVCSHDDSTAHVADATEQLHDVGCRLCIEVTRGFIGKNNVGGVKDGASDDDALLLAAREFVGHLVALGVHAHLEEHLADALLAGSTFTPPCSAEHKVEVIVYVTVNKQLEVLKYNADTLAESRNLTGSLFMKMILSRRGTTRVLLFLCLFMSTNPAKADIVRGRVIDADSKEIVPLATLKFEQRYDNGTATYFLAADSIGNFLFFADGKGTLQASMLGYYPKSKMVFAYSDSRKDTIDVGAIELSWRPSG